MTEATTDSGLAEYGGNDFPARWTVVELAANAFRWPGSDKSARWGELAARSASSLEKRI